MQKDNRSNADDARKEQQVRAFAERIWRKRGGNEVLNGLEAEALVEGFTRCGSISALPAHRSRSAHSISLPQPVHEDGSSL